VICRPFKRKRASKDKKNRMLEERNLRNLRKHCGVDCEIVSHVSGWFFEMRGNVDVEKLSHADNIASVNFARRVGVDYLEDAVMRLLKEELAPGASFSVTLTCKRSIVGQMESNDLFGLLIEMGEKLGFKYMKEERKQMIMLDVGLTDNDVFLGVCRGEEPNLRHLPNSIERASLREAGARVVLAKWSGELYCKGANRMVMTEHLREAILVKLGSLALSVHLEHDLFFVILPFSDADVLRIQSLVANVPGVKSAVLSTVVALNVEMISNVVSRRLQLCNTGKSVRLHLSLRRGSNLMRNDDELQSNVKNTNHVVFVSNKRKASLNLVVVVSSNLAFVNECVVPGLGGLPQSPHHSVVCLLSGGIDSPVAAHLMMTRGTKVVLVHFENASALEQGK
jgi:hypothetical protein